MRRLKDAYLGLTGRAYVYRKTLYLHHVLSFSQEGEDSILGRIFEGQPSGFYIDVGAHHPQRFSNTYRFYLRGWKGINIDPLPGSKDRFDRIRPRDINLQIAIGCEKGVLTYYQFAEPAYNTFDSSIAESRPSPLIRRDQVAVFPLREILDQYLLPGQAIDFLSIDVEGLDEQVVVSNDWARFRPCYVLVEALETRDVRHTLELRINSVLEENGYVMYGKCVNTLIFKDRSE